MHRQSIDLATLIAHIPPRLALETPSDVEIMTYNEGSHANVLFTHMYHRQND